MSKWTQWKLIACRRRYYTDNLSYNGASCYELGIGKTISKVKPVYVGETTNERRRIINYAQEGSHLSDIIDFYLKRGFKLYYRAQAKPDKLKAKRMQDNLLYNFDYDWNIQSNG